MRSGLEWLIENGLLISLAEQYVKECNSSLVQSDKKKESTRFPNLAGFCRSIGVGIGQIVEMSEKHPDEYGLLCAIFEDEALNSAQSATVVSAYMKERLEWGEGEKAKTRSSFNVEDGLKLIFEHNIEEDGI